MHMSKSYPKNVHLDLKPKAIKRSLLIGFLAAVLVGLISIFLPNYFCSEVKILPIDSKASGGMGQLSAAAAAMGVSVPTMDSGDANFMDILKSRTVLEDVLMTRYQFQIRSWRFGRTRNCDQTLFDYLKCKNLDRAVQKMYGVISATKDLKSKIITLQVETRSPELSQLIAQKAIADLETFVGGKGRTKGGEKARFAEARLKESRDEMVQAEESLRRFLEMNRNYQTSSDPSVRLVGARLETELKLRQQLVLTLSVDREQSLLEEKNDIPIVNILDPANLPLDKSSPKRSIIVLVSFFLFSFGAGAWYNLDLIKARFVEEEDGSEIFQ